MIKNIAVLLGCLSFTIFLSASVDDKNMADNSGTATQNSGTGTDVGAGAGTGTDVGAGGGAGKYEEPFSINSGEAEYDGNQILLTGDVHIEHGLGKISAKRLTIIPSKDESKKMRFSSLKMENDILIDLRTGGQLQCQLAEIDYQNLHGFFKGNEQVPDVIYSEMRKNKNGFQDIPLVVKCNEVQADLVRKYNPVEEANQTDIASIRADGNVRAHYNQEYLILSDYATYQQIPLESSEKKGLLTLNVMDPQQNSCVVTDQNGNRIEAKSIAVDLSNQLLTCENPVGTIMTNGVEAMSMPGKAAAGNELEFSSETMEWDNDKQILTLRNNVKAKLGSMADLTTPHEIKILQHYKDNKKSIQSIVAPENTQVLYTDEHHIAHKLMCYGLLTIDHEHSHMTLQSPQDGSGNIMNDKQVLFEDILGEIFADQVQIDYQQGTGQADKKINPSKVTLDGHVKILNRFDGHVQESGSVLQYALADHVEYDPAIKVMTLSGYNDQRVLFYDKVNNVQMSAPMLKVRRDEKFPKGAIQGVGDVRFTFVDHEFDQLKQHFQYKGLPSK